MAELDDNVSQQSNFMDLTLSPEINRNNFGNQISKLDRPPRNFGKIDNLRSIQELPAKYRCIFEFPFFNIIQSSILDDVLYSDVSVVISAPTGSGKTVVFELAIIRLLMEFEETNFNGDFKIVYVAPVKALCHERLTEWHTKFSKIGISCIVSTGDSDIIDVRCLQNYNIIITTPEKWDCLTRNAKDSNILESVKLFMIDEVHLLNEEARGPNLEVIVSRMKILNKNNSVRFVAVSATIPNIEDIAQWLGNGDEPAVYFKIGEELRPVKLNKVVLGYTCASDTATFKFDLTLNYKLQNILMEYAEGKPTLIFCSTRKGVELTASHLLQNLTFHLPPSQLSLLSSASSTMFSSLHKSFISSGIGCHHAGMSLENRSTVETLFREGHLPVLIATSTLAMGVNLPAHLVVVKGTKQYVGGAFQEYSESSVLQMIGRAGRPQFDTSATVVIMTTVKEKSRYEKMLGGKELIESNLHRHLTEHLNAEVVLGTITDIAIALEWLRYTFLYIRVLKNPKHYNIPSNYTTNQIEKKLQDLCQIEINALNKHGMLQIDQTDGFSVSPTNMGTLMANYYLAFNTMKLFTEIKGSESLSDILMLLCKCTEFSETYLRVNDKKTLNTLNRCKYQETIRFPMKGVIKTTPMKIYCIIQATFGCIRIQNPTLCQEAIKIMRTGERIAKCLVSFLLNKNKYFSALLNALILFQCFNAKIWENSPYVSRQFPKIGVVLSSMLVSAGKTNFKAILETNPRDIERIINRAPPMGNEIIEAVMHLPFYKINLEPSENDKFKIKITITLNNSDNISKKCTAGLNSYMTLIIGDTENNILMCKKLYHHTMATTKDYIQYIDVILRKDHVIQVHLISENWVGIDCKENYDIIINQDKISTKTCSKFVNNNSNSNLANQKSITSYFNATKYATTNENKKSKPKNIKTKTIETYFSKQNNNKNTTNNTKLGFLVPNKNMPNSKNETNIPDNSSNFKTAENVPNNNIATPKNIPNTITNKKDTPKNMFNTNKKINDSGYVSNEVHNFTQLDNYNFGTYNENYTHQNYKAILNIPNYNENNFWPSQLSNIFEEENSANNPEKNITFDGNVSTINTAENYFEENNEIDRYIDEFNSNNNPYDFNCESELINYTNQDNYNFEQPSNQPYEQDFNNYGPNIEDNKRLILKKNYLTQQEDFESFSQSLAKKFSTPSQNISIRLRTTNSPKISQNIISKNKFLNSKKINKSRAERIEANKKVKSFLSQYKYSPSKNNKHNFVGTIKSTNNNKPKNNTIVCSQNKESKLPGSQISLPQNTKTFESCKYTQKSSVTITNEELEKFKRFMENRQLIKKNIPCTVTSGTQNKNLNDKIGTQNKNFTTSQNNVEELYPMNFCDVTYEEKDLKENSNFDDDTNNELNKTIDEIIISSESSSQSSQKNEEIIILSDTEKKRENNKIQKPYFPKTFREYVQNSIDKLKRKTLVNEHFNDDFGFQEFLMSPLDETSSEENDENNGKLVNNEEKKDGNLAENNLEICESEEDNYKPPDNNLKFPENVFKIPETNGDSLFQNNYLSPNISQDFCFENVENLTFSESKCDNNELNNITFLPTGEVINKNENIKSKNYSMSPIASFDHDFQTEKSISYSPNLQYENSNFNSNIFTNETELNIEQDMETRFLQNSNNYYQNNEDRQNSSFDSNILYNDTNFKMDQTFLQNAENNFQNDYSNSNIFPNKTNFQIEQTIETNFDQNSEKSEFSSDSQDDFPEKTSLKVDNKMKIIEQFYKNPMFTMERDEKKCSFTKSPDLLPVKRQKLSAPTLFPITRSKKHFKDPIRNNDPFKKMSSLKNILSTYGSQYENKISLANNSEREVENEKYEESVVPNSYNYSIKKTNVTLTIYEKLENPNFESHESGKTKPDKDERKNKNVPFSRPFFRH